MVNAPYDTVFFETHVKIIGGFFNRNRRNAAFSHENHLFIKIWMISDLNPACLTKWCHGASTVSRHNVVVAREIAPIRQALSSDPRRPIP